LGISEVSGRDERRIVVEAGEQEVFPKFLGVSASNKFLTRQLKVRWRAYGAVANSLTTEVTHHLS
jgi:hypothetical protein